MVVPCILVYGLCVVTHTTHKTITEFFSVDRFQCRDSTSAPFPVEAMHGMSCHSAIFNAVPYWDRQPFWIWLWERFQISWELNTDLVTCTVKASWQENDKGEEATNEQVMYVHILALSHAYLLHKNLKVSLYSDLSFYLGLRKNPDSEWQRNAGKNVWTKEEEPPKKHAKTSISIYTSFKYFWCDNKNENVGVPCQINAGQKPVQIFNP